MFTTTLVSAFFRANDRLDRNVDKYIELGRVFLQSNSPKIVFLQASLLPDFTPYINQANTQVIPIDNFEDLRWGSQFHRATKTYSITDNPLKDSQRFFAMICEKTEFVRRAIALNTFGTPNFAWVDFGIYHLFEPNLDMFMADLHGIATAPVTKGLRIAHIWDCPDGELLDLYTLIRSVRWHFAGGVFGGHPDALIPFADRVAVQVEEILTIYSTFAWEVNVWYQVYCLTAKSPDDPHPWIKYHCDHNPSILANYCTADPPHSTESPESVVS